MAKNNYTILIIGAIIIMAILIGPKLMNGTLFSVVDTLDQSQTQITGYNALYSNTDIWGETFTPSGNTSKITVNLKATANGNYNIKLSLWDSPSKSILFASTQLSTLSLTTSPIDVDFPINLGQGYLIPGNTYFFELTNQGAGLAQTAITGNNNYANGQMYTNGLPGIPGDLYFKTYKGVQQTCRTDADTDCNGVISNTELYAYIQKWINSQITRTALGTAIQSWSTQ